jgi:hypothetical protein
MSARETVSANFEDEHPGSRCIFSLAMGRTYEYQDLHGHRSIRLIEFNATASHFADCDIHLSLEEHSLDNPPPYYALPYAWESDDGFTFIDVDDQRLRVTRNCKAAIDQLKQEACRPNNLQTAIFLWVDAICINQETCTSSVSEFAHQKWLMCEIYMKAEATIVWLGCDSRNASYCFDTLSEFSIAEESNIFLSANSSHNTFQPLAHNVTISAFSRASNLLTATGHFA